MGGVVRRVNGELERREVYCVRVPLSRCMARAEAAGSEEGVGKVATGKPGKISLSPVGAQKRGAEVSDGSQALRKS
jgi:hypothetical protein